MKDNLENIVKQSLENYEFSYDASAWTALSNKLDVVKPVAAAPKANPLKWIAAAGVVTVISIGAYVLVTTNAEPKSNEKETRIEDTTTNSTQKIELTQNEINNSSESKTTNKGIEAESEEVNTTPSAPKSEKNPTLDNHLYDNSRSNDDNHKHVANVSTNADNKTKNEISSNKPIVAPAINNMCKNDYIKFKNTNDKDLALVFPNGKSVPVKANTGFKAKATMSGKYSIVSGNEEISSFIVHKLPTLDFTANESLQYEDGLPTLPVVATTDGSNYSWTATGINEEMIGKSQNIRFYTKGEKTITLSAENEYGCVGKHTEVITIEKDYNLFSANGVDPSNAVLTASKFMPGALTVRNTPFTLIIIDIKTGATLFTTSDPNEGWDGIDSNTGQPVPDNTVYAWKVTMHNPLPGEPSQYKGRVEVSNR